MVTSMNKRITKLSEVQKSLVFIIPILYFIIGSYFRNLLGNFSLRCFDPEYIYFMSGLTISDGVVKVAHIDNPGTPLQLLVALIFKITYFIRSTPTAYLDDVFTHPDLYLSVVNLTITLLTTLLLLFAGMQVFKLTRNIFYAVLIQTSPFLPLIWFDLIGRVTPELIMVFPVVLMSLLLIQFIVKDEEKMPFASVLYFALLSAFGLSIKLSFIPILLIPFIVIPTWKKKLIFTALTIAAFFIIAFPVTLQLNIFWSWIKNLFIHSGNYGSGSESIIEFSSFRSNLHQMINLEKRFFVILIVLLIVLAAYLAIFRKKTNRKIVLLSGALLFTAIVQLVMVGKHFAHHYFIPILMFTPLVVLLIGQIAQKSYKGKITVYIVNVALIGYLIWSFNYIHRCFQAKTMAMEEDIARRSATWHFAETLEKDSYKIITSQNYGSPFIEYTLFYSQAWAKYSKKIEYNSVLGRLYPRAYSYFTFSDEMKYWNQKLNIDTIRYSGKNTYLYVENDDSTLFQKSLLKIHTEDTTNFSIDSKLIYRNPETREVIFKLDFQPQNLTTEGSTVIKTH
jgi:hypothetical protein